MSCTCLKPTLIHMVLHYGVQSTAYADFIALIHVFAHVCMRVQDGVVQGPFTAAQVLRWFRKGWFDTDLIIRKSGGQRQGGKDIA